MRRVIKYSMGRREEIWKKKTFRKIFHIMAACTMAVVFLLSALAYHTVKKVVTKQNIEAAMQDFEEIRSTIKEAGKMANSLATQLLLDDVCSGLLFAGDERAINPVDVGRAVKQVSLYKNMNDMVESIYLYNGTLDVFITSQTQAFCKGSDNFYDTGIVEMIEDFDRYRDKEFIQRRVPVPYSNGYAREKEVYTYILDGMGGGLDVAVIVNLSMEGLYEKLLNTAAMKDSHMAVIDSGNETVMEMRNIPDVGRDILRKPVLSMIEKGKCHREFVWQGERYFISYLYSEEEGWNYIKATKWDTVFGILSEIRKAVILLSALVLLPALSASLLSSVSVYQLYLSAEREYKRLTGHKKKDKDILKENFLYDFVNRRKMFTKEELDASLERYGLAREGKRYTLAALKIDNYQELIKIFGEDGIYDIKYGFRNVFEEVSQAQFEAVGIIYRDNTILFLIGTEADSIREKLACVFETFCEKVKIFLEWDFHMMGIEEYVSAGQLPLLKDKLWPEVHNLYFYPPGLLTDYERVKGKYTKQLDYGRLNQKQVLEALHGGKREEIWEAYHKFLSVIRGCDAIDYKNALTWLGFSVARIIDELFSDGSGEGRKQERQSGGTYLLRLTDCDTAQDADCVLEEMFEVILRHKAAAQAQGGIRGRMEEVKACIEEEFRDPNLSLALLGCEFGVSPAYLGKHFK